MDVNNHSLKTGNDSESCGPTLSFDRVVAGCVDCRNFCSEKEFPEKCGNKTNFCRDSGIVTLQQTADAGKENFIRSSSVQWMVLVLFGCAMILVTIFIIVIIITVLWKKRSRERSGPDSDSHSGLIDTNSASRQANDFDYQEVTSTSLSPDVRQETSAPSPSQTANQLLQHPSHPCEVGSSDGVLHSGPLIFQDCASAVEYQSDKIMTMIGWLNSQDWITQFMQELDGKMAIGVQCQLDSADEKIKRQADELSMKNFEFRLMKPVRGKFHRCPNTKKTEATVVKAIALQPGAKVYSTRMEPDPSTGLVIPGCALYSGYINLTPNIKSAMTVGHLFERVDVYCHCLSTKEVIGACKIKVPEINLKMVGRTTADLAFCQLSESVLPKNKISYKDAMYEIELCKDHLDQSHVPIDVMILCKSGKLCFGRIVDTYCTLKDVSLFNTFKIISPDCEARITEDGDSGALVLSPLVSSHGKLLVYGMVIGYWESEESIKSHTVAIRLWDVINELSFTTSDVNFSPDSDINNSIDSGYVSR